MKKRKLDCPAEKSDVVEELTSGKMSEGDVDKKVDLFWAVTDVYNIEKHLYYLIFLAESKRERRALAEILKQVRIVRADLLQDLVENRMGSMWCIAKHLIGCSSQLCEVATKEVHTGNVEKGIKMFKHAKFFHDLFWTLMIRKPEDLREEEKE